MNGKFWGNIGLGAVLVCLLAFTVSKINASSGVEDIFLPEIKVSHSTAELLHAVKLARSTVTLPQSGHMVEASFAVENKGEDDVKNISILCTHFDKNGKEQGRDKWIVFDKVKAHGDWSDTFSDKRFISNSAVRSECQIVNIEVDQPPLFTVNRGHGGHGGHGGHDDHGAHGGHGADAGDAGHGAKH